MITPPHKYRGAQAMIELHETEMRRFFDVWSQAHQRGLALPPSDDPDYAWTETLLRHVLEAARGYLRWVCRVLELPEPQIQEPPEVDTIASQAANYLDHLLDCWRDPLAGVDEELFFSPGHPTSWDLDVCVESMLEHAIVHPMRHRHQLVGLL